MRIEEGFPCSYLRTAMETEKLRKSVSLRMRAIAIQNQTLLVAKLQDIINEQSVLIRDYAALVQELESKPKISAEEAPQCPS